MDTTLRLRSTRGATVKCNSLSAYLIGRVLLQALSYGIVCSSGWLKTVLFCTDPKDSVITCLQAGCYSLDRRVVWRCLSASRRLTWHTFTATASCDIRQNVRLPMTVFPRTQINRAGAPLWAQRIAGPRGELRLNQPMFAKRFGVSAMTVLRWEHGLVEPRRRCYIELGRLAGDLNGSFFLQRAGLQV
jgi:DNA-binding XRE family transcriptional regulator